MASTTITKLSKNKVPKTRAGVKALPAVIRVVFGNGAGGTPSESDSALEDELLRKDLNSIEQMTDTSFRYICTLSREGLADMSINEMVSCDVEGDLVMIRTYPDKNKGDDKRVTFAFSDTL